MRCSVVNLRQSNYDVYIGRGSRWGNPYTHLLGATKAQFKVDTREESIERYTEWLVQQNWVLERLSELRGKVLG